MKVKYVVNDVKGVPKTSKIIKIPEDLGFK